MLKIARRSKVIGKVEFQPINQRSLAPTPGVETSDNPGEKLHDLFDFMRQMTSEMAEEYSRIQKRATEDPGTAGDQGEENWAELLRGWLPRTYTVVTKGRIINEKGETSPQIDILVLNESYPAKLLNKKLYLAGGVVAAFECKATVTSRGLRKTIENCALIKDLVPERTGSPYRELHSPIQYGLLAHSHGWKGRKADPDGNIGRILDESDQAFVNHPRYQLDLLCVADLGTWTTAKVSFFGPAQMREWSTMEPIYGPSGSATTAYVGHTARSGNQKDHFTPIGVLICHLMLKLAWEVPALRNIADYYRKTQIEGTGSGAMRMWPGSIYSDKIRSRVESGRLSNGAAWDEWSVGFG